MTTASEDRIIVLVRHSQAHGGSSGGDHERELTKHGHADSRALGSWLHEHGIGVDEAFCSTAIRAQQTAEGIWDGGCPEADLHFEPRIYNGHPEGILEVVREADSDANVVMVIGHSPGIPALASLLAGGDGSREAHEALAAGYPTSGVALLSYAGHWRDLDAGAARLDRFHVARA